MKGSICDLAKEGIFIDGGFLSYGRLSERRFRRELERRFVHGA